MRPRQTLDQLKGVFVKGCFCDFDFFLASRVLYRFFLFVGASHENLVS